MSRMGPTASCVWHNGIYASDASGGSFSFTLNTRPLSFDGPNIKFTDDWSMYVDGNAVAFKNSKSGIRHLL